jgi:hypothetical protein
MKEWMKATKFAHLAIGLVAVDRFFMETKKRSLVQTEVEALGDVSAIASGRDLVKKFEFIYCAPIMKYWVEAIADVAEYKAKELVKEEKPKTKAQKKGDVDVSQLFS